MPAYHLIFFMQQSCLGPYYPQTILLQQLTKESNHAVPKPLFQLRNAPVMRNAASSPLGSCASHTWEAVHTALGSSGVQSNYTIVLCAGSKTDINYGPCSVSPCMVAPVVFPSAESNPCLLFSFSSSCFHLPLFSRLCCSYYINKMQG